MADQKTKRRCRKALRVARQLAIRRGGEYCVFARRARRGLKFDVTRDIDSAWKAGGYLAVVSPHSTKYDLKRFCI